MSDDRIWILFARRVSGEIAKSELEELAGLIRQCPDRGYSLDIMLRYFEVAPVSDEYDVRERAERTWKRLAGSMR